MKPAVLMSDSDLLDEFRYVWLCAVEDDAEYMDASLELASELMNRGYVGPLTGFVAFLETRASGHLLT